MENKKSQNNLIKKIESKLEIKKTSHLYFHDKFLNKIPNLNGYINLTSLYLHNNTIRCIENLESVPNITNLYLHKNKIRKIENIDHLKLLKRLYLNHNEISVLENLEETECLEQLYLEKQYLQSGESLCFDPRTIMNISKTLQVLNISHNGISSIAYLEPLIYLKVFNASHNKIQDISDIKNTIKNWYYLYEAIFIGNPVCKRHRYRENIIGCTVRLETLDNKIINDTTRCFIKRLEQEKMHKSINLADQNPVLPKNYPPPLQKAVSASILQRGLTAVQMSDEDPNIYVPWNALRKSNTQISNVPPLLRRQPSKKKQERGILAGTFPNI